MSAVHEFVRYDADEAVALDEAGKFKQQERVERAQRLRRRHEAADAAGRGLAGAGHSTRP